MGTIEVSMIVVDGLREVGTDEWLAVLAPVRDQVEAEVLEAPTLFDPPLMTR